MHGGMQVINVGIRLKMLGKFPTFQLNNLVDYINLGTNATISFTITWVGSSSLCVVWEKKGKKIVPAFCQI